MQGLLDTPIDRTSIQTHTHTYTHTHTHKQRTTAHIMLGFRLTSSQRSCAKSLFGQAPRGSAVQAAWARCPCPCPLSLPHVPLPPCFPMYGINTRQSTGQLASRLRAHINELGTSHCSYLEHCFSCCGQSSRRTGLGRGRACSRAEH